jgi:hypothetical protein
LDKIPGFFIVTSCYNRLPAGDILPSPGAVICIMNATNINTLNTFNMKTRTIVLGVVVAVISTLSVSRARAQGVEQPAVKVIPTGEKDVIKLIYGYDSQQSVDVKFMDANGIIGNDKIKGKSFEGGFSKKYKVTRESGDAFWVEVTSPELSVIYKMTAAANGKWAAQLEKTTYNYAVVASR